MIAFVYQLMDWIRFSQPHAFVAFFIYVWVVWTVKVLGSRRYMPAINDYTTSASVVMPVYAPGRAPALAPVDRCQ